MERSEKLSNRERKRRIRNRNSSAYEVVTKQQVKNMINSNAAKVTRKYLTTPVFNVVVPTSAGTLVQPALPAQGVTNGQREGDSLGIDMIEARVIFLNDADTVTATNAVDACRLICLQARASTVLTVSSPAAPTTGVLDNGTGGSATDISSFINFNAKNELFHVLYDKVHPVNFLASNAYVEFNLSLKPRVEKVNFTPTTTTALCGAIFWIAQTQEAANCNVILQQRLIYHDL
jgi:hypothetical protein